MVNLLLKPNYFCLIQINNSIWITKLKIVESDWLVYLTKNDSDWLYWFDSVIADLIDYWPLTKIPDSINYLLIDWQSDLTNWQMIFEINWIDHMNLTTKN